MLLALLSVLAMLAPGGQEVPKNDGWVTDLADILTDSEEQTLESLMESYKRGTDHEIALLTIPSLNGDSLEEFSLRVARQWEIGQKELHNGALLVISKEDRKIRIEVGRGLEGDLTDAISGRIIKEIIGPTFNSQGFYPGILAGVGAMHSAIGGDYAALDNSPAGRRSARRGSSGWSRVIIQLIFIMVVIIGMGRRRGMSGMLPWLILGSMNSGRHRGGGFGSSGGGLGGGGFSGFGGGGGFSGGGSSGGW